MAVVLAQHNLPVAIMDHLSPLFRDMFPDSSVAKSFCAARTKSTCILNMALRPHFEKILIDHMKTNPFLLLMGLMTLTSSSDFLFFLQSCLYSIFGHVLNSMALKLVLQKL